MHDMDMSDTNATFAMMVPYLHFTRGDSLWLQKIAPTSPGAVAGACVFLFALAAFERLYAAWSTSMRAQWAAIAQPIMNPKRGKSGSVDSADSVGKANSKANTAQLAPSEYPRTIPPFIWSHDVPRGFLFIGASILRYALMLAVMTYSASYILAILIGLSVGEIAFGRYAQFV